jgi:hypothetical protein
MGCLTAGKFNSSAWLRDQLLRDGLRARQEKVDLGIETSRPADGGKFVAPAEYDAVLRAHCRIEK